MARQPDRRVSRHKSWHEPHGRRTEPQRRGCRPRACDCRRKRLEFRGLHYYDGQYGGLEERERTAATHAGYDCLLKLVSEIQRSGVSVPEVITAGTPTFASALAYEGFRTATGSFTASRLGPLSIAMPPVWRSFLPSTATAPRCWY